MRKILSLFSKITLVFLYQILAFADINVCDEYAEDIKKIEKEIFSKKGTDYYVDNKCQSLIKNDLFCQQSYGDLKNKYNELLSNLFILTTLKELKADISKSLDEVYYFQNQDIKKFENNLKTFKQASFTGSVLQESFKSRIGKNATSPWVEYLESSSEKSPEGLKVWVHKTCEKHAQDSFCQSVKAAADAKVDEKILYSHVLGFVSVNYHVPQDEKKQEALAKADAKEKLDEYYKYMNFKNGEESVSMSKLLELSGANKLDEILVKMKADPSKKKAYEEEIIKLAKDAAPFLESAKLEINSSNLSEALNKQAANHLNAVRENNEKAMLQLFSREDQKKIKDIEIDQVVLKEELIKTIQDKFEKHQKLKANAYLEDTYGEQGHKNDYEAYESVKKKILEKNCNDELRAIDIKDKGKEEAQFATLSQIGTCYFGASFTVTNDADLQTQIEVVQKQLADHKIALNLYDNNTLFAKKQLEKKNIIRDYFTECNRDIETQPESLDLIMCKHDNENLMVGGKNVASFIDRNKKIIAHSNLDLLAEVKGSWDIETEQERKLAEEAKPKTKDGRDERDEKDDGGKRKVERVMIDEEIERLVGEKKSGPGTLDYITAGSLAAAANMVPSVMQYQSTQRMMGYQMNNAAAYRNSLLNRQMYGSPYYANFGMGYRNDWGTPNMMGSYFRSNYIPYMTYDYGYRSMLGGITGNTSTSSSGWNFTN
ncbi:MAG: hypothetical protein JNM93_05625 [Bacteriovoracaceae bacterium]|nr:hypothetical protein [Bacteriovoracaceae bacterium]